jgi:hypothetical protein
MRILHMIVTVLLFLFVGLFLVFRITDGSFEAAGARMDRIMGVTADEVGEVAEDAAVATDKLARDIADGPDDEN